MDVQGFELAVLRGARKLLAAGRVSCVALELQARWLQAQNATPAALIDTLKASGFRILQLQERCTRFEQPCIAAFHAFTPATLRHSALPNGDYLACTPRAASMLPLGRAFRSPTCECIGANAAVGTMYKQCEVPRNPGRKCGACVACALAQT